MNKTDLVYLEKLSRQYDFEDFKSFCENFDLEESKFSQIISTAGAQEVVVKYGDNLVIKFPKKNWVNSFIDNTNLNKTLELLKKELGKYVASTQIIYGKHGNLFVYKQEYYSKYIYYSTNDYSKGKYRKEFSEIINGIEKIKNKHGIVVDLIGAQSFWPVIYKLPFTMVREFSNLGITNDNMKIIDFNSFYIRMDHKLSLKKIMNAIYGRIHWKVHKYYLRSIK